MKKYELTEETKHWLGRTLHRIRALTDIGGDVKAGDLGGWVQSEDNLSHDGDCWVCGNAKVCDNAWVSDNAVVCGKAVVYDNAVVCGKAVVYDNAWVSDNALVYGNAQIYGKAVICGKAEIARNADVHTTSDYIVIGPIGSRNAFTTFYRSKDNQIYVKCGCKNTDIDTWLKMVDKKHGNNKHGQAYRKAAELARIQIDLEDKNNEH